MIKDKTPLLKALIKNKNLKLVPFHMPGHKRGRGILNKFRKAVSQNPFCLDVTEIPGLDDLHNSIGPIKQAQDRAAALFGADKTMFLVNGTTVGIHAAIMGICKPGDEIILPRDVHRSVIGGCILAGVIPRYIPVGLDKNYFIPVPVGANDVSKMVATYPAAKAVFQVYPSYYGLTGDMQGICIAAHTSNIPVIVDEAHGSHLVFSPMLPPSALQLGADVSIQSTHKTLSALTQASMLHVKSKLINENDISQQLRILQSTSPSYLLMASLDAATGQLEISGRRLMTKAIELADETRIAIEKIPGVTCLGREVTKDPRITGIDTTKLLISLRDIGITGFQAADLLRQRHGIQVELSDRYNILCMFSLGTTTRDSVKLVKALKEIAGKERSTPVKIDPPVDNITIPPLVLSPREAWFSAKKKIPLEKAGGRVSAEMVAPYPPGIPVLCPGEKITPEVIDILKQFKAQFHSFHGPVDQALDTIMVLDN